MTSADMDTAGRFLTGLSAVAAVHALVTNPRSTGMLAAMHRATLNNLRAVQWRADPSRVVTIWRTERGDQMRIGYWEADER